MGLLDNIISSFSTSPEEWSQRMAANDAGWKAEGKRLAVNLPEVTVQDAAKFMAEMTPILGDAIAAKEVWDEATSANPNWPLVLALGGATAIGLIPGAGDAIAKSVKSGARGLLDTAKRVEVDPNAMGSLLGDVRLKPKADASPSIRAYHGSPYKFDQFSMDKIGTGEGAQVYGRGLYFAEEEDVARMYKEQLSGGASSAGKAKLERYKGDVDSAINDTLSNLNRLNERNLNGEFVGDEKRLEVLQTMHTKVLRQLNDYKDNGVFSSGSMYEVNIDADPDNFLDWDKTVGSQTEKVKSLLGWTPDAEQAYLSARNADDDAMMAALSKDSSGANYVPAKLPIPKGVPAYDATGREIAGKSSIFGSGMEASKALKDRGIPGVKYLDQGSRPYGEGTRNYVVFDDKLINIVKRYGVAGAATMLGVTAMDVEQAMAQGSQQSNGLLALQEAQKRANEEQYRQGLLQ